MSGSLDGVLSPALETLENLPPQGLESPEQLLVGCPTGERTCGRHKVLWAMPLPPNGPAISPTDPSTLCGREEPGEISHPLLVELAPPPLHFSSHPSPSPRPPLQPGGKRSPVRSPTTFPLESAASAFEWRNHLECITGGRESREQENVSWPPRFPSTGRRGSGLFKGWASSCPHFSSPWTGQIRDVPGSRQPMGDGTQASGHHRGALFEPAYLTYSPISQMKLRSREG